jgi:hypothetical protein
MDEISSNLPQVFIDNDIPTVQNELSALGGLSQKFRTASKVSLDNSFIRSVLNVRPGLIHYSINLLNPAYDHYWMIYIGM